jgi:capsular polysaccharide transport system permease protein
MSIHKPSQDNERGSRGSQSPLSEAASGKPAGGAEIRSVVPKLQRRRDPGGRIRREAIDKPEPVSDAAPLTLPVARRRFDFRLLLSFLICVVIPAAVVGGYSFFLSAHQYQAEFRFAVTEVKPVLTGAPPSSQSPSSTAGVAGGLSALLGGFSVMNTGTQTYIVIDYLKSRSLIEELESRLRIRELYGSSRAGMDWWNRFEPTQSMDHFVEYWKGMADATYDPITGIASVKVRAFSAKDAQLIADTLVELSEDLVNSIARRPQLDAIRFSENELRKAEDRMKQVRAALTEFRYREGVIDPVGSISGNVDLVKSLRLQIVQLQTELAALGTPQQTANSPTAQVLRSKIEAARAQLAKVEAEVSQNRDGNRVLVEIVNRYEQLDLDRQYAQAMLVSAMQALDQARGNAAAQHLYLTPYVRPILPQSATYPRPTRQTVLAALAFFAAWVVGLMIVRSVREQLVN